MCGEIVFSVGRNSQCHHGIHLISVITNGVSFVGRRENRVGFIGVITNGVSFVGRRGKNFGIHSRVLVYYTPK